MRIFRGIVFALCLSVLARPQFSDADWRVYGEINSIPRGEPVEIEQGGQVHFQIATNVYRIGSDVPYPYTKPLARVTWSIQPAGAGVSVSADGTVAVSANATPGGYKIMAKAGIESRSRDFLVYNPKAVPIKGTWSELAEISCGGTEMAPEKPMRELIFRAGGQFSATWIPFEIRNDYRGSYTYDVKTQKLVLQVDPRHNNHFPTDISPEGSAHIDDRGRLVIRDLWLGTPPLGNFVPGGGAPKSFCGYVFTRPSYGRPEK